MFENSAAGCHIGDRYRSCGEIEVGVALEVHGKARVCVEVGQPVPLTRCPRDEETAVDVEHPDLDPARQPGVSSRGRDVHGRIVSEFDAHNIHSGSVRRPNFFHATYRRHEARMRRSGRLEPYWTSVVLRRCYESPDLHFGDATWRGYER